MPTVISKNETDQEFDNNRKDAGEIMSDHTTIALYELAMSTNYQDDYYFKTTLRYKDPLTEADKEVINTKADIAVSRKADYDFAGYVAEYALLLVNSKYKALASYEHLLSRIDNEAITDKYKDDFVSLVRKSQTLSEGNY